MQLKWWIVKQTTFVTFMSQNGDIFCKLSACKSYREENANKKRCINKLFSQG